MSSCIKGDSIIIYLGPDIVQKIQINIKKKTENIYSEVAVAFAEFNLVKYITDRHLPARVKVHFDKKVLWGKPTIWQLLPITQLKQNHCMALGNHTP